MCYPLKLANEFSCGHRVIFSRNRIDCNLRTCALSMSHKLNCSQCTSTCDQRLMQEQTWTPRRQGRPCESCLS
ncbi:hypothetical protein C8J55DRAFT_514059, partial [Lentinula edodes]